MGRKIPTSENVTLQILPMALGDSYGYNYSYTILYDSV